MLTYQEIFASKNTILFVTAHPDDVVVFFGGLIHQLREDQKEVFVLMVTNGARGSRENEILEVVLAKQRIAEEVAALEILGVSSDHLFCLNRLDGEVESNLQLIGEIAKYIRQLKVDLVATHEPGLQYLQAYAQDGYFVQHRDHRQVGEAVIDAVYPFSRDRSFFPEHYAEGLEPHTVYNILLTDEKESNFSFDCSAHLEIKKQAMRAHQSQFSEETIEAIIKAFTLKGKCAEHFQYLKLLW